MWNIAALPTSIFRHHGGVTAFFAIFSYNRSPKILEMNIQAKLYIFNYTDAISFCFTLALPYSGSQRSALRPTSGYSEHNLSFHVSVYPSPGAFHCHYAILQHGPFNTFWFSLTGKPSKNKLELRTEQTVMFLRQVYLNKAHISVHILKHKTFKAVANMLQCKEEFQFKHDFKSVWYMYDRYRGHSMRVIKLMQSCQRLRLLSEADELLSSMQEANQELFLQYTRAWKHMKDRGLEERGANA